MLDRWSEAAILAPCGSELHRPDTVVVERPGWYQRITPSAAGSSLNEVVLSRSTPDDVEATIDRVIAQYHELGKAVKWCVGPWSAPDDLGERLTRRGFQGWDVRGMGRATEPWPVGRVEAVDRSSLDRYLDGSMRGWSIPDDQRDADRAALERALGTDPPGIWLWVATDGADVVGTAGLVVRPGCGYLIGTQVEPRARGQGRYRDLVGARLAFLRDRGVPLAVTQAREATSAPILERLGFETLFRSRCYLLERGA